MGALIDWLIGYIMWALKWIAIVMIMWLLLGVVAFGPWSSGHILVPWVAWFVFHVTWWLNGLVPAVLQLAHFDKLLTYWNHTYWRFVTDTMPPNALDYKTQTIVGRYVKAPWGWRPRLGLAYLELLFWPLVVGFGLYGLYRLVWVRRWSWPWQARVTPTPTPPTVITPPPPPAAMPAVAVAGAGVAPTAVTTATQPPFWAQTWFGIVMTVLLLGLLWPIVFSGRVMDGFNALEKVYTAATETGLTLTNSPKQLGNYKDADYNDPIKAIQIANAIKAMRGTSSEIQNARVKLSAACGWMASAQEGDLVPGSSADQGGINSDQAMRFHQAAQSITDVGVEGLSCKGLKMSTSAQAKQAQQAKSEPAKFRQKLYNGWLWIWIHTLPVWTVLAIAFIVVKSFQQIWRCRRPLFRSRGFWRDWVVGTAKYAIYGVGALFVLELIIVLVPKALGAIF